MEAGHGQGTCPRGRGRNIEAARALESPVPVIPAQAGIHEKPRARGFSMEAGHGGPAPAVAEGDSGVFARGYRSFPSFPRKPAMVADHPAVAGGNSGTFARSGRPASSFPRKRESTRNRERGDFPWKPAMARGPAPAVAEGDSGVFARGYRSFPSFPRKPAMVADHPAVAGGNSGTFARSGRPASSFPRKRESTQYNESGDFPWKRESAAGAPFRSPAWTLPSAGLRTTKEGRPERRLHPDRAHGGAGDPRPARGAGGAEALRPGGQLQGADRGDADKDAPRRPAGVPPRRRPLSLHLGGSRRPRPGRRRRRRSSGAAPTSTTKCRRTRGTRPTAMSIPPTTSRALRSTPSAPIPRKAERASMPRSATFRHNSGTRTRRPIVSATRARGDGSRGSSGPWQLRRSGRKRRRGRSCGSPRRKRVRWSIWTRCKGSGPKRSTCA